MRVPESGIKLSGAAQDVTICTRGRLLSLKETPHAQVQQSTRITMCENCRHFRMTHICSFILNEEETPDKYTLEYALTDITQGI